MVGKLTLLVAVVMVMGVAVVPAHAQGVHVENTGAHEVESELSFGFYAHIAPGVEVPVLRCDNEWALDIGEDGSFTLNAEDILSHPGSSGSCETQEPCNNHQLWDGFTEETGPDAFAVHLTLCLEGTGSSLDGVPVHVECGVELGATADSAHCDFPIEGAPPLEFMGELFLHDKLGLMHG